MNRSAGVLDSSGHAKTISPYLSPDSFGTMDGYVHAGRLMYGAVGTLAETCDVLSVME
jgi:hypothetical protein